MTTPQPLKSTPELSPQPLIEPETKVPANASFLTLNKTKLAVIIGVIAILLFSSIGYFFLQSQNKKLADQLPIQSPPTEQTNPTPATQNEVSGWKTYTNATFNYSIDYPADWSIREFPDTKSGAAFRPSNLPNDYQYEYISINKYNRVMFDDQPNLTFEGYVKKAGAEIQNYNDLVTMNKIVTNANVTGYTATWMVQPMGPGKASESLPRTYFEIPGDNTATIQVVLDEEKYLDIYHQMLASFKLLEKKSKPSNPNLKTYTSPALGISFTYLEKQDTQTILVKENGNVICITYDQNDITCDKGQSVEVFQKGATETLKAAISRIFLAGKDPNRCLVSISDPQNYPATFVQGAITFPENGDFDLEKMAADTQYCSEKYAQTNGIRYFLEDKLHPNKFLFLGIGQYAISSDNNQTWQETISFQ